MQIFTGYRIERRKKMTRYTKKIDKNYSCKMNEYMWTDKSYNHSRLGIDKLGKLEDIEEELGVDLIKLLTADEIYYKAHGEIESNIFDVSFYSFLILVRVYHSPYRKDDEHFAFGFNDYGKTWAFTKEELE